MAVDSTPFLVQQGKDRGVDVVEGNIEQLPFATNRFDVVYARHILEHLENFEKALKELLRVCKKEVVIVFFVPPEEEDLKTDPNLGHQVYLNRYSRHKIEDALDGYCIEWISIGSEVVLHIIKSW